jgi:sporulation protein YlmC with PRC-barrel domain
MLINRVPEVLHMIRSRPNRLALPLTVALGALALALATWAAGPSADGAGASHSAKANVAETRAVRASRAIGMDVRGRQGETIGQVRDLLVNTRTGLVRYVVLSRGRETANGERVAPVPVSRLTLGPARQSLVYDGMPERLEKVTVPQSDWNDLILRDPDRLAQLDSAWGLQRRTAARLVRPASTLLGQPVSNPAGTRVGEIEDLVLHINQSRASYAVLRLDRNASGDEKRIAVPLRALTSGASQAALSLNINPARLQALKGFSREAYQNPNDPAFVVQASGHLGAFSSGPASDTPAGERRQ